MKSADRLLHSANILISTVGAVTAEAFLPGTSAALGGTLSVSALFNAKRPRTPALDMRVKDALSDALDNPKTHLPKDADKLIPQMIEAGALTSAEIMAAARDPEKICAAMLAKLDQPDYRAYEMQAAFTRVVLPIFSDLLGDPAVCDQLRPAFEQALAGSLAHIQEIVEHLKQQSDSTARKLGIQEGLLIALARRYAEGNPDDFDSALTGLERALETAAEEREKGRLPGNLSDAVDAVMERVDVLNDKGEIDAAADILWDEIERQEAAQARLIDKGIAQAVLTRNVDLAVQLELKRWALDGGGFDDLHQSQVVWYERGRDRGLRYDLEVAIALAQVCVDRAQGLVQRGTALNDLGNALKTLGARESGTDRLQEAVAAYSEALKEWTRERVPLEWAGTQNNLGNAMQTLGARESGTDRLQEAVAAYSEALKEQTRERVPLDWATTQNNLGNALKTLGARESGTDRLQEAVTAYSEALKEWTRERVPLEWAGTQNNLGNALKTLGARESGTDRLQEAVTAYSEALKERTRERVPLDWAMTQNNLGNALTTLGARESGTDRLQEAVAAYSEALKERTRERVQLDWAATQHNLCNLHLTWFDKTGEAAHLDLAQEHLDHAREVFDAAKASRYQAMADDQQKQIDAWRINLRKR